MASFAPSVEWDPEVSQSRRRLLGSSMQKYACAKWKDSQLIVHGALSCASAGCCLPDWGSRAGSIQGYLKRRVQTSMQYMPPGQHSESAAPGGPPSAPQQQMPVAAWRAAFRPLSCTFCAPQEVLQHVLSMAEAAAAAAATPGPSAAGLQQPYIHPQVPAVIMPGRGPLQVDYSKAGECPLEVSYSIFAEPGTWEAAC
jgi:hypothetical protein